MICALSRLVSDSSRLRIRPRLLQQLHGAYDNKEATVKIQFHLDLKGALKL